ncbi:exonuclease domain-containing protein [Pseudofulvibacter geojedonensis]|uniref:Exonuclease domain-containing protein n=1 Tax=Pseudofulvibacter geojedonensis TaxID=1123758 RepID=A0ABW3HZH5_9FLAO
MYAIIDIETTGGKYNEEGITEIAIYKFDGHEVIDQFISLVNPEKDIQPFVVKLTGINNKMLRNAPKFYEVAKRIVEITEGCIIVAHNASFDYRILQIEFKRLGFDYKRQNLCTVELSKKLLPEQEKYSLGKLVRALGIPMSDRHRASGDAMATVKLFKLLLTKDLDKKIVTQTIKAEIKRKLPQKFLDILDTLPTKTGVYYIHKTDGTIIYIGKSKNIKKRINQHFTGKNRKSKSIQREVAAVTYEETGSELIALLKESQEIKHNNPKYNRSQKHKHFQFALYQRKKDNGYNSLYIGKLDARKKALTSFVSINEAKNFLFKITEQFHLCQYINGLSLEQKPCFLYETKGCKGACCGKETSKDYNKRVNNFITNYSYKNSNKIIIDRGRNHDERSAILIENGEYKGYGFYNLNYQVTNIDILKDIIVPMEDNRDTQHIIQSHLRRKKVKKIIDL